MLIKFKNHLHPGQQEIWDEFIRTDKYKRAVVNTGRQVGKTTLAKRAALYWAIKHPGCEIGWICPENKHFLKVFIWLTTNLAPIIKRHDSIKNIIYFDNGSTMYFFSVDNYDAIRGNTFDYRIMDEFAFGRFGQPEAIDAYDATMVAKGKKDLLLSTPKGKNQHYDAFQYALTRDDEFTYEMKTADNPSVDKEYLRKKKLELPLSRFQQEYEGKFVDNGGEVFSGLKEVCSIASYPTSTPTNTYCTFGIDWGAKNDKSVLTIMDNNTCEVLKIKVSYHDQYPMIIADFVEELNKWNISAGYAEVNGVGQSAFDHFKLEYPYVEPFTMSQSSKQEIVTLLRTRIQEKEIKLPSRELEPELYNQLSDYEVYVSSNGKYSYGHPKGKHDDYVDSLMLASLALRDFSTPGLTVTDLGTGIYDIWDDIDDSGKLR